jgi:hypothetical protein
MIMRKKGNILRVKRGYNPNSSSIGSDIFTFLAVAAGAGAFSVVLLNILQSIDSLVRRNKENLTAPVKGDEG